MTPTQHTTLLASGNPGLDDRDDGDAGRGLAIGCLISAVIWLIGFFVARWFLA